MRLTLYLLLAGVTGAWFLAGVLIGAGPALSEHNGGPALAVLLVFYIPIAGGALLTYGVRSHLNGARIAGRRGIAGAVVCLLAWGVAGIVANLG